VWCVINQIEGVVCDQPNWGCGVWSTKLRVWCVINQTEGVVCDQPNWGCGVWSTKFQTFEPVTPNSKTICGSENQKQASVENKHFLLWSSTTVQSRIPINDFIIIRWRCAVISATLEKNRRSCNAQYEGPVSPSKKFHIQNLINGI
jgi:hypothetical protein